MNHGCIVAFMAAGLLLSGARTAVAKNAGPPSALPDGVQEECWLKAPAGDPEPPCSIELAMTRSGTPDRAVLVRERQGQRRRGIAIQLGSGSVEVLGAGRRIGAAGADLVWMKAWSVLHPLSKDSTDADALLLGGAPAARPGKLRDSVLVVVPDEEAAEMANLYGSHPRRGIEALGLTEPRRRFVAFDLLERYQVEPVKGWLLPGLEEPDEMIRLAVAHVLAAAKVTEAIETIGSWLQPGPAAVSPFARDQVARDLGRFESSAGIPALAVALADPAPDVREAAVLALGQIGRLGIANLVAARLEDPDRRVRLAAASTLGPLPPDPTADAALVKAMADPDQRTRLAAVESTGKREIHSAIPTLLEHIHDPDGEVQFAAVAALGALRAREAVSALLPLLKDSRGVRQADYGLCWRPSTWLYVECAAANALVRIGDAAGIAEARKRVPRCLAGL
jgi:HEAT repeat protein